MESLFRPTINQQWNVLARLSALTCHCSVSRFITLQYGISMIPRFWKKSLVPACKVNQDCVQKPLHQILSIRMRRVLSPLPLPLPPWALCIQEWACLKLCREIEQLYTGRTKHNGWGGWDEIERNQRLKVSSLSDLWKKQNNKMKTPIKTTHTARTLCLFFSTAVFQRLPTSLNLSPPS